MPRRPEEWPRNRGGLRWRGLPWMRGEPGVRDRSRLRRRSLLERCLPRAAQPRASGPGRHGRLGRRLLRQHRGNQCRTGFNQQLDGIRPNRCVCHLLDLERNLRRCYRRGARCAQRRLSYHRDRGNAHGRRLLRQSQRERSATGAGWRSRPVIAASVRGPGVTARIPHIRVTIVDGGATGRAG